MVARSIDRCAINGSIDGAAQSMDRANLSIARNIVIRDNIISDCTFIAPEIHVHVYKCIVESLCTYISPTHTHINPCTHTHAHTRTHTHLYTPTSLVTHTHTHTFLGNHIYVYTVASPRTIWLIHSRRNEFDTQSIWLHVLYSSKYAS